MSCVTEGCCWLKRCQLCYYLGFLAYGRLVCYGVPIFTRSTTRSERKREAWEVYCNSSRITNPAPSTVPVLVGVPKAVLTLHFIPVVVHFVCTMHPTSPADYMVCSQQGQSSGWRFISELIASRKVEPTHNPLLIV